MIKNRTFEIPSFDGEKLFVKVWQNSDQIKQTIIFLHGIGGDINYLQPTIVENLNQHPQLRCICFDQRGHGFSSNNFSVAATSIDEIAARDLLTIIKHFDVQKPILFGHSYGGIAIQTYLNLDLKPRPHRVLLLSTPLTSLEIAPSRKFWFKLLQKNHSNAHQQRSLTNHLKVKNTHDLNLKRIGLDIAATGYGQWLLIYLSVLGWKNPHPEKLNNNQTTVILGAHDFLIWNKQRQKIFQTLPLANHITLNANHHQAYLTQPQRLANIIGLAIGS